MDEFIASNDGLSRRFADNVFELPDYTTDELRRIFISMCKDINITVDEQLDQKLNIFFENWHTNVEKWGNAGQAEILLNGMYNKWKQERIKSQYIERILTESHIPEKYKKYLAKE
jgi:hypothetical protein